MPMPLLKRALLSVGCEREAIPSPKKTFSKKLLTNAKRYNIINTERGKENPSKPRKEREHERYLYNTERLWHNEIQGSA